MTAIGVYGRQEGAPLIHSIKTDWEPLMCQALGTQTWMQHSTYPQGILAKKTDYKQAIRMAETAEGTVSANLAQGMAVTEEFPEEGPPWNPRTSGRKEGSCARRFLQVQSYSPPWAMVKLFIMTECWGMTGKVKRNESGICRLGTVDLLQKPKNPNVLFLSKGIK